MKKMNFILKATVAFCILLSVSAKAQKFPDLDKSPMDVASFPNDYKNSDKIVKVVYSRPQLKGRSLEKLTPNGKVWRTGANEATEITFYKDLSLGDTRIKAGTYSLYTIPENDNYTIIINKDLNVWGAYSYKKENDVARLSVPVRSDSDSLEAFGMVFTKTDHGIALNMGWDKTRVVVPFVE